MCAVELSKPFLLSECGATRASAYHMSNKSIRIGDTTFVTWLDAVSGIRVRSYDHQGGSWSDTVGLDEGCDNHANPSLAVTPEGKLRVAYGPHGFWGDRSMLAWNHGRFRMQETVEPADITRWITVSEVGYGATYACLVTDSQGRDHLVYRGGPHPPGCFYERRLTNGGWDLMTKLSVQRIPPGYTFVGANLVIGPGDVAYCGFQYYSMLNDRSTGVCVLKSEDAGETWTGMDGRPAPLPLEFSQDFAPPHAGHNPYLGSLAVDLEGNLVALTMDRSQSGGGSFLSVWRDGRWDAARLDPFMPEGQRIYIGNVTVDAQGRVLVVVDTLPEKGVDAKDEWGNPLKEICLLVSRDGGRTFEPAQVSDTCKGTANWLPNITRTGPNHDLRSPLIIYTQGFKGEGCRPDDRTRVYAVWVE